VFSGDLQLGLAKQGRYVYANPTVVRGPLLVQAGTKDIVENPSIVVEVLSPSSGAARPGERVTLTGCSRP
jgi:hypothetical protein